MNISFTILKYFLLCIFIACQKTFCAVLNHCISFCLFPDHETMGLPYILIFQDTSSFWATKSKVAKSAKKYQEFSLCFLQSALILQVTFFFFFEEQNVVALYEVVTEEK